VCGQVCAQVVQPRLHPVEALFRPGQLLLHLIKPAADLGDQFVERLLLGELVQL